jgi:hypothetical protein
LRKKKEVGKGNTGETRAGRENQGQRVALYEVPQMRDANDRSGLQKN